MPTGSGGRGHTHHLPAWAALLAAVLVLVAGCTGGGSAEGPSRSTGTVDSTPGQSAGTGRWWDDRIFYEIFVRSFQDSNGDGIGDLRGVIQRLDYLNDGDPGTDSDLGITGIWLMPVFDSPSYHGYDTVDYRRVNPQYGSNADLAELVAQAHARGIAVILDLAINHTSAQHPWFRGSQVCRLVPLDPRDLR
jgi:alpha-amylase